MQFHAIPVISVSSGGYGVHARCRICVLEKRLKRHEEQALQRYIILDRRLREDVRLKAMLE